MKKYQRPEIQVIYINVEKGFATSTANEICPKCGTFNHYRNRYCYRCGTKLY